MSLTIPNSYLALLSDSLAIAANNYDYDNEHTNAASARQLISMVTAALDFRDAAELLSEREAQIEALTEEVREELDSVDDSYESNPILFAESGPNRFRIMSLFFTDTDGVTIQEDLDLDEITISYFTDYETIEVTEGAFYAWALDFFNNN
jgi:hypothetical protein